MFRVAYQKKVGGRNFTDWMADRVIVDDIAHGLYLAGWQATVEVKAATGGKPTLAGQADPDALRRAAVHAVQLWNHEAPDGTTLRLVIRDLAKAAGLADPTRKESVPTAEDRRLEAEETAKVVDMIEGLKVAADRCGGSYICDQFGASSILAMIDTDDFGQYAKKMMEVHAERYEPLDGADEAGDDSAGAEEPGRS